MGLIGESSLKIYFTNRDLSRKERERRRWRRGQI